MLVAPALSFSFDDILGLMLMAAFLRQATGNIIAGRMSLSISAVVNGRSLASSSKSYLKMFTYATEYNPRAAFAVAVLMPYSTPSVGLI